MIDHRPDEQAKHHFRSKSALWSGLVIGALFLFLSKGVPWGSLGLGFTAMGRAIPVNDLPVSMFVNGTFHMILAVLYAFVIGWAVYRLDLVPALIVGAATGIVLFGANYLLFNLGLGMSGQNEFPVAATHFFFGLMTAAAYKALSVRRVDRRQTV